MIGQGRLLSLAIASALTAPACAPVHMEVERQLPLCRTVVPPDYSPLRWIVPFNDKDRRKLRSWCDAVGPVVVYDPGPAAQRRNPSLAVISWNMAVGKGDLSRLLEDVRAATPNADLIVIVQEAYRSQTLPPTCAPGSGRAAALGLPRAADSTDIVDLAKRFGMRTVYAPSMRNGLNCAAEPREDRGNAILSTLPISDVAIIELPFAQQRRVAVAALVDGSLGIISTHFDTVRGHRRMAKAIVQAVAILGWKQHVIVSGDFNSALPLDGGLREMRKHFSEVNCGSGPTQQFGGRLDHMFVATVDASVACSTGRQRYGSDHHPLIAIMPS